MARSVRLRGGGLVLALGAPALIAALAAAGCRKASRAPDRPTTAPGPAAQSAPAAPKPPAAPPSPRPGTALTHVASRPLPGLPELFDPSGRLMAVRSSRPLPDAAGDKPGGGKPGGDKPGGDKSGESKPAEGKAGDKPAGKVGATERPASEPTCELWEVDSGSYLGAIASARCDGWLDATALELPDDAPLTGEAALGSTPIELRSRDGQRTVRWHDNELLLRTAAGAEPIKIQAGCGKKGACADLTGAALSPDGKRLALTRLRAPLIHIIDAATGKALKPLKLEDKAVLPGQLGWSDKGLAAILFEPPAAPPESASASAPTETEPEKGAGDDDSSDRSVDVSVMFWPDGQGRGKERKFTRAYSREFSGHLLLDPLGRYVFDLRTVRRDGETLTVFDVAADHETGLGWNKPERNCEEQVTLQDGRWIPGKWPVWEVIEEHEDECSETAKQYKAFRVFTAPGQRRLRQVDLGESDPSDGPPRIVRDDGKTIARKKGAAHEAESRGDTDAEQRWQGTGKGSIKRLSDGEELFFETDGCVRTGRWVFDCSISTLSGEVFLIGSDPLDSPVISGDQVAHLFYRPGLADDFFAGKPVAPDGAVRRGVGLPPVLEQASAQPLRPGALQVTLLARDGGDGVSVARAWLAGRPLGEPLKLGAGQPSQLELALPAGPCREPLLLFACNGPGTVCSPGQKVPVCGKRRK